MELHREIYTEREDSKSTLYKTIIYTHSYFLASVFFKNIFMYHYHTLSIISYLISYISINIMYMLLIHMCIYYLILQIIHANIHLSNILVNRVVDATNLLNSSACFFVGFRHLYISSTPVSGKSLRT